MEKKIVVHTGAGPERALVEEMESLACDHIEVRKPGRCTTPEAVLAAVRDADVALCGGEPYTREVFAGAPKLKMVIRYGVGVDTIDLDAAPAGAADAYLRLHLLSTRLAAPRTINLDGIFGALANVVWTSAGPCAVDDFEVVRLGLRAALGHVTVFGVDKFPRMVDYVVPSGVRIADADRVRLGAHLAEGTTVMHEGFVNFNAGTLGASMVEGRISAGVV